MPKAKKSESAKSQKSNAKEKPAKTAKAASKPEKIKAKAAGKPTKAAKTAQTPASPEPPTPASAKPESKLTRTRKPAQKAKPSGIVPTTEEIGLRAYYIAERRQAMGWPGDSDSDWLEAEAQLRREKSAG